MRIAVAEQALFVPHEWAPQRAIWTAWPADPKQWNGDLEAPRRDVAGLVRALALTNRVRLLVANAEAEASAKVAVGGGGESIPARYGGILFRGTSPMFWRNERKRIPRILIPSSRISPRFTW